MQNIVLKVNRSFSTGHLATEDVQEKDASTLRDHIINGVSCILYKNRSTWECQTIIRRKYSYKKMSIKEPEWSHLLHWHVVLRQRREELEPDRHICCLVNKIGNINACFQTLRVEEDMIIEDGDMIVTCAKKSSSSQLNWCCLPVSQSEEGHHGEGLTGRGWGSRFSSPLGRPWMILFATMMTMMMIMTTMTKMRATRRQREWDSHFFLPWVITIHANCNIGKEGHP